MNCNERALQICFDELFKGVCVCAVINQTQIIHFGWYYARQQHMGSQNHKKKKIYKKQTIAIRRSEES